ncbi:alpha/beta hydrolase [soil metagenome]
MPTPAPFKSLAFATASLLLLSAGVASAQSSSPNTPPPAFPRSATPPPSRPAADMQAVLDAQSSLGAKPIELLTPAEARLQPSPADGVKAVLKAQGRLTPPDPSITTREFSYSPDPASKVRVYFPPNVDSGARKPVIVYFHGGGWVIADLDTYDATPRLLSQRLNAIVVSVAYRHSPEHCFPSQQLDAKYAYEWAMKQAAGWHGDRSLVIVAGESAGGNLAVNVAIHARNADRVKPKAILAVYPIASGDPATPSKLAYANAKPLNTPMLQWFTHYVVQTPDDTKDPRFDLTKADLLGLHPVTIINAEIDPLRDDGALLEQALRAQGVRVERRVFPGVTHEFFGMGLAVRGAYDAEAYAVERLRTALDIIYPGEKGSFSKGK